MKPRISRPLRTVAFGLALETRARCQDDNHPAGVFNHLMGVTFCHCGRVQYFGFVEQDRWPDRDARLADHIGAA